MADIKTINAVPVAGIKTYQNIPLADVKTITALTLGAVVEPPEIDLPVTANLRSWYTPTKGVWSRTSAFFNRPNAEYLQIASSPTIRFGNIPWTIGGWAFLTDTATTSLILAKRGVTNVDYQLYVTGGSLYITAYNGGGYPGALVPIAPAAWHFIVGSYDGAGTLHVQLNNGSIASVISAVPVDTTEALGFGTDLSNPTAYAMPGFLQNWFLMGRALDAAERTYLYNGGAGRNYGELSTDFKTNLRAWWPFDEKDGSRVDVHNGLVLTDVNTVTSDDGKVVNPASHNAPVYRWEDQGPAALHVTQANPALRPLLQTNVKNGNSVVTFNGNSLLQALGLSLAAGPVAPDAGNTWVVADSTGGGAGTQFIIQWTSDGNDQFIVAHIAGTWYNDHGPWMTTRITGVGPPSPWAVMEAYRSGAAREIKRDGVSLGTYSSSTGALTAFPANWSIGLTTPNGWVGPIGEIAIYSVGQTAGERATLLDYFTDKWIAPALPDIAGLQAWYKADAGAMSRSAAQFTAANVEYLSAPNNSSLRFSSGTPYTIGGWFYFDALTGVRTVFGKGNAAVSVDYQFYLNGGNLIFNIDAIGVAAQVLVPAVSTWYFVVAQHDGAGNYSIRLNDGTPGTGSPGIPPDTTDPLFIGAGMGGANPTDGRLQNLFMFGRLLSAAEMTFLYNSGNGRSYEELDATFKTDLRAWWPLDETDGSRKDKHTNGNHLTDVNTVSVADGKVLNPASHNSLVHQWQDQSGNGRHLTAPGLANRPYYQTNARNGRPVIYFEGHGSPAPKIHHLTTAAAMTIGSAFSAIQNLSPPPFANYNGWLNAVPLRFQSLYQTVNYWLYSGAALGNFWADGVSNYYVDTQWRDYAVTGTPVVASGLQIGIDQWIPDRIWYGPAGELIIYDTELSAGDRVAVEQYLRDRWALP